MLYALEYLVSLGLFLLVIGATGWTLERLFWQVDAWRWLVRLCLGFAFWTLGVFALLISGMFGGLGLALLGSGVVIGAASAWRGGAFKREHQGGLEHLDLASALLLCVLLLPLAALAMSPPVSWDANVYHLALPKLFIEAGSFEAPLFSVYAHWPLGTELLFTLALWAKDYILAKLIHFAFGALVAWTLFQAGRQRWTNSGQGVACGALAALFFLANPVVAFEMRVAYVDLAQAFFTLAAVLFLGRALDSDQNPQHWMFLAGLSCGLVAGTKVTGIVLAAVLGMVYLSSRWRIAGLRGALSVLIRSFVPPVLLFWLPWILKTWWQTGNPIYPLLHNLFGGPHWNVDLAEKFTTWQSSIGMGREPLDYLFLPLRVIFAGGQGYERFDGELGTFWIFLLPLVLLMARKQVEVRLLLGTSTLLFLIWALTSQQMRFLIPVLPLLALASALSLTELIRRWRGRQLLMSVSVVGALMLTGWTHQRLITAGFKTFQILDERPKAELQASAIHPIYRTINETLPADAKLLLINTNHVFFIDREYMVDSFFEASQIASWLGAASNPQQMIELLQEQEITHVLLGAREVGIPWPQTVLASLGDPSLFEVLERTPDERFVLLALRPTIG